SHGIGSLMARAFLTYSTAVILQAIANGYRYGFDVIDITGLPGGTVYPALRRLEGAGHLTSTWEKEGIARAEPRPPRKDYGATRPGGGGAGRPGTCSELRLSGREALGEAVKRYRLLEQTQPSRARAPKPSRA